MSDSIGIGHAIEQGVLALESGGSTEPARPAARLRLLIPPL